MALSKTLTEYFIHEFKRSLDYRQKHLAGFAYAALNGELEVTRELIKHAVHSSMGFESLGKNLGKSPKSLHRSCGPGGNPTAKNTDCGVDRNARFLGCFAGSEGRSRRRIGGLKPSQDGRFLKDKKGCRYRHPLL